MCAAATTAAGFPSFRGPSGANEGERGGSKFVVGRVWVTLTLDRTHSRRCLDDHGEAMALSPTWTMLSSSRSHSDDIGRCQWRVWGVGLRPRPDLWLVYSNILFRWS